MRTIKLTIAYDGAAYAGWQMQGERPTVQAALETALRLITGGEEIRVTGASRTDAGVHALGQVVSFHTHCRLPAAVIARALNAELPPDISVREAREMPLGFHAIRDSIGKRYRYVIQFGWPRDVFARHYAWWMPQRLDVPAMQRAARPLVGTHDFASFQNQGSERETSVRTLHEIAVQRCEVNHAARVHVEIEGTGFLYMMVRNIVGTLVQVGRGKQSAAWPGEVLATRDRTLAGMTAPPQGLYLLRVDYPPDEPPH